MPVLPSPSTGPSTGDRATRNPWPARVGRFFRALANVYAGLIGLYLLARALTGSSLWPVALASHFAHWLLLPAFLLLPLELRLRRRLPAVMNALMVAVFLWWYGALFLPNGSPPAEARTLTVMSLNVEATSTTPAVLLDLLREAGADIVGIQELSAAQANALDRDLRELYPYQVLHGIGIPGEGLLSRYPIRESEVFLLAGHRLTHIRATVEVDGVPLTVITAHPPPLGVHDGGYRAHPAAQAEIEALVAMATSGGPVILLGDFNTTDQGDLYRLAADAGLVDAFRVAGWGLGLTWPAAPIGGRLALPPLIRIDFVWHTAHFQAVRAWVGPGVGSDHLPVLAELAWIAGAP